MLETGALEVQETLSGFWLIDNLAKVTTGCGKGLTWQGKTSQRLELY